MISHAPDVVAAFSEDQVQLLTGLTRRQLRYWDATDFFAPAFAKGEIGVARRFYGFRDIVGLRTISTLMKAHRVTLQHLRKVAEKLSHLSTELWKGMRLYVHDRAVVIVEPDTQLPREVVSGQYVLGLALEAVISDTRRDVEKLKERPERTYGKLERSRGVLRGQWVVAGTRIPVSGIQDYAQAGYSIAEIIAEYPDLKPADVEAALAPVAIEGIVAA